jgi:hypothetical protein
MINLWINRLLLLGIFCFEILSQSLQAQEPMELAGVVKIVTTESSVILQNSLVRLSYDLSSGIHRIDEQRDQANRIEAAVYQLNDWRYGLMQFIP